MSKLGAALLAAAVAVCAALLAASFSGCASSTASRRHRGSFRASSFRDRSSFRAGSSRTGPGEISHTVQPGENFYRIGLAYGLSAEDLMQANQMRDPRELRVGQVLLIPRTATGRRSSDAEMAEVAPPTDDDSPAITHDRSFAPRFEWPIAGGTISSPFGVRNGVMHDGVDIATAPGTPVRAASDGRVIFSGRLRGYGNVVILQHENNFVTVYAHNSYNAVSEGAEVKLGQVLGEVGTTGRTTGPNLHFEVRHDNIAGDPMQYLPPPERPAALAGGGS
jgi:murein DD-endopeptidase MepM/ murein hydrolase activator NlpD